MMYLGQLLWDSLPQEVKRLPLEAIPDQPCRLKISSNSSAIDDLPWEWLNDGTGLPFALRPQVRLARSVPIRLAMPPMRLEAPLRVLLFTTNPKDERLLHSPREIQAIKPRLSAPPYTLKVLEEPTWGALVAALREEQPHILHYVGHTGLERGEGNLILHDSNNLSHWISGQDLSWVLPPTVRLLCLGTCFTAPNYQILGLSRLALTSAKYRLPTSVANRYQVTESSVEVFWRAFYSSLAYHGNANEAFYEAQHEVASAPDSGADWGSFSLIIRDQSGLVLEPVAAETRSPEKHAEEIQAQLASSLANDLAERLATLGPHAPESLHKQFEQEAATASDLSHKLYKRD